MFSRAIMPIMLWGSLLLGGFLYLNATSPYLIEDLRKMVNPAKPTAPTVVDPLQGERERQQRINALVISQQNKLDLSQGRPFWGCAQHMAELAFNDRANNSIVSVKDQNVYEFQTFTFNGRRDPVIMEFRNNQLVCVHYPASKRTSCAAGQTSYYANASSTNYPFNLTQ